jgi:hypothetical protein
MSESDLKAELERLKADAFNEENEPKLKAKPE